MRVPKFSDGCNTEAIISDFQICAERQLASGESIAINVKDVGCYGEYKFWLTDSQMTKAFNRAVESTRLVRSMNMINRKKVDHKSCLMWEESLTA